MATHSHDVKISGDGLEVKLARVFDTAFMVQQLNRRSEKSWAVVGSPSGAVAFDDDDRLLMKLTKEEAEAFAESKKSAVAS